MSSPSPTPGTESKIPAKIAAPTELSAASQKDTTGLTAAASVVDDMNERLVDQIEMLGEEVAAGYQPVRSEVTPGMRFLHSSRTIHQLVNDRNRAVGVFLAVASLLWTASGAVLNAKPSVRLAIPIEAIQYWCFPFTFGILTVLALFTAFLLIRTRIGLIYEVAKMNALLGLPVGRVTRIGWLSIFFIMHLLISLAGGGSALLFTLYVWYPGEDTDEPRMAMPLLVGSAITVLLIALYVVTVLHTTADRKLNRIGK